MGNRFSTFLSSFLSLCIFTAVALVMTGCLGKLEDLTGKTKAEVEQTRLTQTGGGVLDLLGPDRAPFQIADATLELYTNVEALPESKLSRFLGLTRNIREPFIVTNVPNVPYVYSTPDAFSLPDRLINPVPLKTYLSELTAALMGLNALALGDPDMPATLGDRMMYITTALLGARKLEAFTSVDPKTDKLVFQVDTKLAIAGMKMMRGLVAKGIITSDGAGALEKRREVLLKLSPELTN